jgi:hypothetical protein
LIAFYEVALFRLCIFLSPMLSVGQQPTTALYSSSLLVQEGVSFCLEGIIFSQSRMPQLDNLIMALTAAGLNPNQILVLMGFIFSFFFLILSILLIFGIRYVFAMFRHYTSFMETVFLKNREGGVLHEFSYSWLKGVTLKPIPSSLKKEDGDSKHNSLTR